MLSLSKSVSFLWGQRLSYFHIKCRQGNLYLIGQKIHSDIYNGKIQMNFLANSILKYFWKYFFRFSVFSSWIIRFLVEYNAFELWCWRRLLTVPWTARRSNQPILKGNQSWIFIRRTDAKAEAPGLWSPDAKSWFVRKDPDAWKIRRQEEKGWQRTRWHHRLNGHEFYLASSGKWWRQGKEAWCPNSPCGCSQTWLKNNSDALQYKNRCCN